MEDTYQKNPLQESDVGDLIRRKGSYEPQLIRSGIDPTDLDEYLLEARSLRKDDLSFTSPLNQGDDYVRLSKWAQANNASFMIRDYHRVFQESKRAVSKEKTDILIMVPIRSNSKLEHVFRNLAIIDLPAKTGVLLGFETGSRSWTRDLIAFSYAVASRFAFVKPIWLATPAMESTIRNGSKLLSQFYRKYRMKPETFNIMLNREKLRLISRSLSMKAVLWFDSDQILPRETIIRLYRLSNEADVVSTWTWDWTDDPCVTNIHSSFKITRRRDLAYVKTIMPKKMKPAEAAYYAISGLIHLSAEPPSIDDSVHSFPLPYWQMERRKKPFDILACGFGCVLASKELNDRISFLSNGYTKGEDIDFCRRARMLGCRIICDPYCKLIHSP